MPAGSEPVAMLALVHHLLVAIERGVLADGAVVARKLGLNLPESPSSSA